MADSQLAAITIRDWDNQEKNLVLYFASGVSVATITTALQSIETALDTVIDGVIVGSYIVVKPALASGLKATAGENSVSEGGSMSWHLTGLTRSYNQFWPSLKDTYVSNKVVNVGHADIVAVQNAIADSVTPEGSVLEDIFRGKFKPRK